MSDAEVIFRTGPHRVLESGSVESLDSGGGWGSLVVSHGEALALAKALAQALAEKHREVQSWRIRAAKTDNRIAELEEALALDHTPDPDTLHSRDARAAMDIVAKYGVDWDEVGLDDETIEWIVSTAHRMADAMAAERDTRTKE